MKVYFTHYVELTLANYISGQLRTIQNGLLSNKKYGQVETVLPECFEVSKKNGGRGRETI